MGLGYGFGNAQACTTRHNPTKVINWVGAQRKTRFARRAGVNGTLLLDCKIPVDLFENPWRNL